MTIAVPVALAACSCRDPSEPSALCHPAVPPISWLTRVRTLLDSARQPMLMLATGGAKTADSARRHRPPSR